MTRTPRQASAARIDDAARSETAPIGVDEIRAVHLLHGASGTPEAAEAGRAVRYVRAHAGRHAPLILEALGLEAGR